jgi:hypothetical protein
VEARAPRPCKRHFSLEASFKESFFSIEANRILSAMGYFANNPARPSEVATRVVGINRLEVRSTMSEPSAYRANSSRGSSSRTTAQ